MGTDLCGAAARGIAREICTDARVDFKDAHASLWTQFIIEVTDARKIGEERLHRRKVLWRNVISGLALHLVLRVCCARARVSGGENARAPAARNGATGNGACDAHRCGRQACRR